MSYHNIIKPPPHKHFYGWVYIIEELSKHFKHKHFTLHPFLDRDVLFFPENLKGLLDKDWMGIVHFPTHGAPLIHPGINSKNVVNFINESEFSKNCKGLITLSKKSQKFLSKYTDIPIYQLWHPKYVGKHVFDIDRFFKKPQLRHPGKAYRDFFPFFNFQTLITKEINIEASNQWLIDQTLELKGQSANNYSVKISHNFLDNQKYINKLTSSLGFGYYYDCEASNSILEHLMTHTPTIVNKLPSIQEYLGKDYPMYYENIESDPDKFILNKKFILDTYKYLKSRSKKKRFTIDYFCHSINSL